MEAKVNERVVKSTRVHLAMEANETLRIIKEEFQDNPESMEYFYDLFNSVYCDGNPVKHSKKVIGAMCIQTPEELIYAAGAVPVRLCNGSHSYEQVGAESTSAKTCSLVNATVGTLTVNQAAYRKEYDMVAIPATCDQKKKSIGILKKEGYNVYTLDVPSEKNSENARHYWQSVVKDFALALQKVTGNKLTKASLKDAIVILNRARYQLRRLNGLRATLPSPILAKDVFLATNSYFFDDIERWTGALANLNDEIEERVNKGFAAGNKNAPRIMFAGTPPIFPNLKLPLLTETLGGEIVADESCSSTRMLHDAVVYDEANYFDMIPAIADRYLKPCMCPIFDSNEDRIRIMLDTIKSAKVDGVIYQAYSGCQLYTLEHHSVAEALMKDNIPMLYVETDYGPEDNGQISTRVEAFLESIQTRKRRK